MSILRHTYTLLTGLLLLASGLISCDALHEDMDPCPRGLRLRFVYDYNMEYANAFPSQVDCLTLLVYDKEGNYLGTHTASSPLTSDENWRMDIDLPAGTYRLLAYGGMDCRDASFQFVPSPETVRMQQLEVELPSSLITSPVGTDLHPMFYGALEAEVPNTGTTYTEATVRMMKDTNDIRILLANETGIPTDAADFNFTITDNNTRYNYLNEVISTRDVTYWPWAKGNSLLGYYPDTDLEAVVAWAELSVGRLMEHSDAVLTVTRVADGRKVLSIPLINVLLELKSEHFRKMEPQEFLDRESRWNMTFILTGDGSWLSTKIIINNWIVRINNITGE